MRICAGKTCIAEWEKGWYNEERNFAGNNIVSEFLNSIRRKNAPLPAKKRVVNTVMILWMGIILGLLACSLVLAVLLKLIIPFQF